MSFIAGIAEKVVSSVTSSLTPTKAVKKVVGLAADASTLFREIEDAVLFPKAKIFDKIIALTPFGKNRKLAKAAKALLLFENFVAIRCQMEAVKGAATNFAEKCDGARPLPIRALQQKETYAPELRKELKVKIICAAPSFVAEGLLRTDQVAVATGKLVKESVKVGTSVARSALLFCFGGDLAKEYTEKNLVTTLARLKETIMKNPEIFAKDLKAQAKHIDTVLEWVGVSYRADDLIKNILGEKKMGPQKPQASVGTLDAVGTIAMRAFFSLINMTTDLQCALPYIAPSTPPQPISTYRSDDGSSGSGVTPRPYKNDERRFL